MRLLLLLVPLLHLFPKDKSRFPHVLFEGSSDCTLLPMLSHATLLLYENTSWNTNYRSHHKEPKQESPLVYVGAPPTIVWLGKGTTNPNG